MPAGCVLTRVTREPVAHRTKRSHGAPSARLTAVIPGTSKARDRWHERCSLSSNVSVRLYNARARRGGPGGPAASDEPSRHRGLLHSPTAGDVATLVGAAVAPRSRE